MECMPRALVLNWKNSAGAKSIAFFQSEYGIITVAGFIKGACRGAQESERSPGEGATPQRDLLVHGAGRPREEDATPRAEVLPALLLPRGSELHYVEATTSREESRCRKRSCGARTARACYACAGGPASSQRRRWDGARGIHLPARPPPRTLCRRCEETREGGRGMLAAAGRATSEQRRRGALASANVPEHGYAHLGARWRFFVVLTVVAYS